jgi:DNA-binding HxlR family transcriptional regulator
MKRKALGVQPCSIAKALDIVGEWWSPLVLRNLSMGMKRFEDLQGELGISRNILSDRLSVLVEGGVVEKVQYCERPPRYEYHLTHSGRELVMVLLAIQEWGDRWVSSVDEPYGVGVHEGPDGRHRVHATLVCDVCGPIDAVDVRLRPGPSFHHHSVKAV